MIDPISWEFAWPYILAAFLGGYLLGSIPFGLILTRLSGLSDIRQMGSGSIGATNVLRTGRKGLAAATLVLDAGKGALAVYLGNQFGPDTAIVAAAGVVIGHLFPVWLRFRGGKGVATGLGVLLALAPWVALAAALAWLVVAILFRYSSLATLAACVVAPVSAVWLADPQRKEFTIGLAVVIVLSHHANIRRLLSGTESKIELGRRQEK